MTTNIDLGITFTTAERNAWATIRPKVRSHIRKVLRVYRALPPEKRAVLREHCNVLDAVLDIIEE